MIRAHEGRTQGLLLADCTALAGLTKETGVPCGCRNATDRTIPEGETRNDARRYRTRGPAADQIVFKANGSIGLKDAALRAIGSGSGATRDDLLVHAAREAAYIDVSSAYLKEAKEEAARRVSLNSLLPWEVALWQRGRQKQINQD